MSSRNSVMSKSLLSKQYIDVDIYPQGDPGDIFVPSVSSEGVLSWTRVSSGSSETPEVFILEGWMHTLFVDELPNVSEGEENILYAVQIPSSTDLNKQYILYHFISAENDPNQNAHYERLDSSYFGSPASTISNQDISNWNNKAEVSDIPDVSNFITKDVNNLTYYTLSTATGSTIDLSINSSTYVMTLNLKDKNGTTISTDTVDLPLESMVINATYDKTNKKIILTLQSGSTIDVPVGDLVSGLQTEITSNNKLSSDLVDDTNRTHKFVTSTEKTTWNNKQNALVSGTNIKTINNQNILGNGNININDATWGNITGTLSNQTDLQNALEAKQDTLVSGTSIKTINNTSLLGSGNITIDPTIPNSSYNVTGGIRTRLDTTTNTLYITNDGTDA